PIRSLPGRTPRPRRLHHLRPPHPADDAATQSPSRSPSDDETTTQDHAQAWTRPAQPSRSAHASAQAQPADHQPQPPQESFSAYASEPSRQDQPDANSPLPRERPLSGGVEKAGERYR